MKNRRKRIVILGGAGMLGHRLWLQFKDTFDTFVTLRKTFDEYRHLNIFEGDRTLSNVDIKNKEKLFGFLEFIRPDIVINCIGVVKQKPDVEDHIKTLSTNALFPHELAKELNQISSKLIHISTDCVFYGDRGNYTEEDLARPPDLYGRTKLSGEVISFPHLTIRTSIIGHELFGRQSLLEWFLSQSKGSIVKGYTKAIFTGFTTIRLAEILKMVIDNHPDLSGLYHLASHPITKLDLLEKIKCVFKTDVKIAPYDDFFCDRSLNAEKFNKKVGFAPPSWDEMIEELGQLHPFYHR